jgi:hypothetical protein
MGDHKAGNGRPWRAAPRSRAGARQRDIQPVQATRFGGHDVDWLRHDYVVVFQSLDQAGRHHGDVGHVDERDEFFRRVVGGDDGDRRVARSLPDYFPNCSVEIVDLPQRQRAPGRYERVGAIPGARSRAA